MEKNKCEFSCKKRSILVNVEWIDLKRESKARKI